MDPFHSMPWPEVVWLTRSRKGELHGIIANLAGHVFDIHLHVDFLWLLVVVDHLSLTIHVLACLLSLLPL